MLRRHLELIQVLSGPVWYNVAPGLLLLHPRQTLDMHHFAEAAEQTVLLNPVFSLCGVLHSIHHRLAKESDALCGAAACSHTSTGDPTERPLLVKQTLFTGAKGEKEGI